MGLLAVVLSFSTIDFLLKAVDYGARVQGAISGELPQL
jgi:hypothetical protein